jgi:predicted regulator of Ras-like GTPase activity (Roadblock/LC7/MglB family)
MQSLYDVFAAISADEGDHVSAMGACLDTNATLQSPSIERRILVGVAALALGSYLLSTTGVYDANLVNSADTTTIDAAVSASTDSTIFAEIAAAATGLSQFVEDVVQLDKENLDNVGETILEVDNALQAGILDQLRRFGTELAQFITKLL